MWFWILLFVFFSQAGNSSNSTDTVPDSNNIPMRCNGYESLCDKSIQDVAFASSHNSMSNAIDGWFPPDNIYGLTKQLQDGVRALVIDVHPYRYDAYLCHAHCIMGAKLLFEGLMEVRDFLDENPNEIILFVIENYVPDTKLAEVIQNTGLAQNAYIHDAEKGWPTLREMINSHQNLVFSVDTNISEEQFSHRYPDYPIFESDNHPSTAPEWIYSNGDLYHLTTWDVPTPEAFNCEADKVAQNPEKLYLLNHFLLAPFTQRHISERVNYNPFLRDRAMRCLNETGRIPNVISLTFYSLSDLFSVIDELNGVNE